MKKEQFKNCIDALVKEYKKSKEKYPDFESIDVAWRAIQREYCEVKNEILRDNLKKNQLANEMLHLSNVALQGFMLLSEKSEKE